MVSPADLAFIAVLDICRIGSCMMLLPGFGSTRLPMRIRSLLAIAISLALFPVLYDNAQAVVLGATEAVKVKLLVVEIINGTAFGLLARLFMIGLQFSATILTNTIGLAPTPGAPIDDTEAAPPLVTFISLCGTMMIFTTNMHLVMLRALVDTYDVLKLGAPLVIGWHLDQLIGGLEKTSELGLRLCSPYIIYSIIVNLSIGFVNKFTPQISVYFVTTGMVATGGLFMLYFSIDDWLNLFQSDVQSFFGSY
jgi:flagellar biosynthesis protein FliR